MGKEARESSAEEQVEKHRLFKKYIEPHVGLIYTICMKYTKSQQHIEDNYQECLMNFYRYIFTYNPEMSILTWVHIVSKRYVINVENKRAKEKQDFVQPEDAENQFVSDENEEGGSAGITMENYKGKLSDEVLEALSTLNPIYRDTFLKKICGYKLKEIMEESFEDGSLKNKNLETVKSRQFLARKHLQTQLREYYDKRRD